MKRIFLSLLSLCVIPLYAQSDSLSTHAIDEVVVEEVRQPLVRYNTLGKTYWSIKTMEAMPMSDPLRNIQLLPGVQTASENVGGTFVQGCDNSHNYTTINGAPVYYPMHLLGYFSTFNSSYFKDLTFSKSMHLTTANRLGAEVGVESADTVPRRFGMDMDFGLLTAQAAMRIPLGEKLGFAVAGRYSDVNLVYDRLVNSNEKRRIAYCFYDLNMGMLYTPTERDVLSVDFYQGCDYAGLDFFNYEILSQLEWGNRVASLRWNRRGGTLSQEHVLYYSAYHSALDLEQMDSRASLPAHIQTLGGKSELRYMAGAIFLTCGVELMHHAVAPQAPQVTGSIAEVHTPQQVQRADEGAVYLQADYMFGGGMELIGGLRASGFHNGRWHGGVDPRLTLRCQPSSVTTLQLTAGTYTQYLHQVGFSSNGLPSEFWIASDGNVAPQRSGKVSLAWQQDVWSRRYRLSVETYLTRLAGQVEYRGNALGLLTETYDLYGNLVVGDGYNYGIDLMMQKNAGRLTGWISYSWAKAPRSSMRNGELLGYPSVHNREHDFNVVANWKINDKWNCSATCIYATGTPYTGIKNAYILGETGIVNYEAYNSSRYPALVRLDLGVTRQLSPVRGISHSVKFAVYNATFAKNPISYDYYNYSGSVLYRRPVYIFSTAIPSVSYFMRF